MKKILLLAMLALPVSMPTFAGDAQTGKKAAQVQPSDQDFDKRVAQMQEQMKQMQAQMDKIRQTQDPQERQKLLREHWTTMQNAQGMMYDMRGPGMMGCCMGSNMMGGHMMNGPMMWGDYQRLSPEQLKQRQYMMDQYMGMQQQMMDQMMEHQGYMWMH